MEYRYKILHVVNISFVLPYYIGEQFDYFQEKGIEFYVACSPSSHLIEYAKHKKIHAVPVNILREVNIIEDLKAVKILVKLIKEEKIDIVVGHTPKGGLLAMFAAYLTGINKRIYFRHGLMFETSKGLKCLLLKNIERITGLLATKVLCVSMSVLEKSNTDSLSSATKNLLLNKGSCNGIDALTTFNKHNVSIDQINKLRTQYHILPSDRVIGFVGRLVNDKGINELVEAWEQLVKTEKNIKLFLIGPFEKRDRLSNEVKEYIRDSEHIIHAGLIQNIVPYYSLMNMFILPSYREGLPTVVLEASAMELPIITTKVTGCKDAIIENITGVFTSLDPKDIVKHIQLYLDNPLLARTHGENGRSFVVNHFEQRKIWKEIEEKLFEFRDY